MIISSFLNPTGSPRFPSASRPGGRDPTDPLPRGTRPCQTCPGIAGRHRGLPIRTIAELTYRPPT